jgi:hypothetical protein
MSVFPLSSLYLIMDFYDSWQNVPSTTISVMKQAISGAFYRVVITQVILSICGKKCMSNGYMNAIYKNRKNNLWIS